MTSWTARDHYASLWVVCAGLLTYLGALQFGGRLIRAVTRFDTKSPFDAVTSVLLGVLTLSSTVQLLGVLHLATRGALLTVLAIVWAAGIVELIAALRRAPGIKLRLRNQEGGVWPMAALLLLFVTLATNLAIAAAPSTKFDEIFYHMLVPARVVHDQALRFYAYPLHAAALPQLLYQLSQAPLHALGVPDAPNVVSWALSVTMFVFFFRVLRRAGHERAWAALWCAGLCAGLHAAVSDVTAGPDAFGELALAALMLAVFVPGTVGFVTRSRSYALALGVCTAAAAVSKLSTTPVAVLLFAIGIYGMVCSSGGGPERPSLALAAAPGVIFVVPIVLWEWSVSGAPAGPFLGSLFPGSVYAGVPVHTLMIGGPASLSELVAGWSPLVWIGMIGSIVAARMSGAKRGLVAALALGQAAFIFALLTRHPRFLGGLTYGSAMLFAIAPPPRLVGWMQAPRARALVLLTFVAPWVAADLYYARPFAQVVFALETPEQFREKYVGNYADFRALDSLLPRDAVLLATEGMPSIYAPRFMVWSASDAPTGAPLFQVGPQCSIMDPSYVRADTAYMNPSAHSVVYRDPTRAAETFPFCALRLH